MTIDHERKLKTAETTTLNLLKGKTKFNNTRGKLRYIMNYITKDELMAIFTRIENTDMYAPKLSKQEKIVEIKLLKDALGFSLVAKNKL